MHKTARIGIIGAIAATGVAAMLALPPIPQDQAYHLFADTRAFFGIPNFGDVAGNFAFIVFGLMGLHALYNKEHAISFSMKGEKFLWAFFFLSAALIGIGSGYYHLNPNNATLVWDRLPMTMGFMSFFSLIVMERIDKKKGLLLFPLLLLIGSGSVFYWDYTESLGRGDLRAYALVQFLPLLLIPAILWLFPARYTGLKYLGLTLGWYVLAKLLEHFDARIFDLLGGIASGHTLKHLAAAMGVYTILLYIRKRTVIKNG